MSNVSCSINLKSSAFLECVSVDAHSENNSYGCGEVVVAFCIAKPCCPPPLLRRKKEIEVQVGISVELVMVPACMTTSHTSEASFDYKGFSISAI